MKTWHLGILIIILLVTSCKRPKNLQEIAIEKQREIVEKDKVYFGNVLGWSNPTPSSDFLKSNRESALENAAIWLSNDLIDTVDFLDYVLPHQVNNAVNENWRRLVHRKIPKQFLPTGNVSRRTFIEFCNKVNTILKKDNIFGRPDGDESFYRYTDYLFKKWSCVAMSDYANYTFRALGIPVATDFVQVWGNLNSAGHTWNRLLMKDTSYAFMGAESNIGDYAPMLIAKNNNGGPATLKVPPKVYRHARYSKDSFALLGETVVDVTREYVDVWDVSIEKPEINNTGDIYLATVNSGRYVINSIGQHHGNKITFKDMAIGLVYFPVSLDRARPSPVGYPVVCSDKGNETKKPDKYNLITIKVNHLNSLASAQSMFINERGYGALDSVDFHDMDVICPKPVVGELYELYYWDFGWKKHGSVNCSKNGLIFKNVPDNGIYIVKSETSEMKECRPFSYREGKVNWF